MFSARHAVPLRREKTSDAQLKTLALAGDADDVRSAKGSLAGDADDVRSAKYRRRVHFPPVGGASLPYTRTPRARLPASGQRPGHHSREYSSRQDSPDSQSGQSHRTGSPRAPSSIPISDYQPSYDGHHDEPSVPIPGSRFYGQQAREGQHSAKAPSVASEFFRKLGGWEVPSPIPSPPLPLSVGVGSPMGVGSQGTESTESILREQLAQKSAELQSLRAKEASASRKDFDRHQPAGSRQHSPQPSHSQQRELLEQRLLDMQRQITAGLNSRRPDGPPDTADTLTSAGAEDWIVDASIEASFADTHLWWNVLERRWEDKWESMIRSRIYTYLTDTLPAEMYKGGADNDIKFIYKNVLNLNRESSDEQVVDLQKKVLHFSKGDKPMKNWLDEFDELIDECNLLRAPVSHDTVRTIILSSIKEDERYKDVVRDMYRHKAWDMPTIYTHLFAAATSVGDLVKASKSDDHSHKPHHKANKAQMIEAEAAVKVANEALAKVKLSQRAHGDGKKDTRKADAEGDPVPANKKETLKKEICKSFLFGTAMAAIALMCHMKH